MDQQWVDDSYFDDDEIFLEDDEYWDDEDVITEGPLYGEAVKWDQYPGIAFRVFADDDAGNLQMHMVGDDRTFYVNANEVSILGDEDFCSGCGQMGCGWSH